MARIRTIKPAHTQDRELPKISLQAHLLWILSWCFSDDEGVFDADPLLLKSNIFPRRTDVRLEQVEQWLEQLVKARYIIPFIYEGESYYIHRTFKTHQKIDRPQGSKVDSDTIRRILDEYSTNDIRTVVAVKESKGEESKVKVEESVLLPWETENFKKAWEVWKKYKKDQHRETYKSILTQQTALKKLSDAAGGSEPVAIKIIEESISNLWKGLFPLKNNYQNGTKQISKHDTIRDAREEARRLIAEDSAESDTQGEGGY